MCGFLGLFSQKPITEQARALPDLLELSGARGPDDSRIFSDEEHIWLGFNRLAILELSEAGTQPMRSDSGRYKIVFNGEIYNHLDLREELDFNGWNGHSDTETILQCVEEWGFEKTVERLDGMFALAIYDSVEKALLCARDFAGIKPFFYGWNGAEFLFASQYDQVISHPLFAGEQVDPQVLRLYLEQHFMPAPFGILKNTGQLEPGEWCRVDTSGLTRRRYWEFPQAADCEVFDEAEAIEVIKSGLSESVRDELLSDVPLGAFLSGGIDSPLVCHFASQARPQKLKTFTIGSESVVHNESEIAQKYAELIGTDHHCEMMSADSAFRTFETSLRSIREPMADFSILPTYLVSALARRDVTVSLSGDGGDELFFGYERFWSVAKNIRFQSFPWVVKAGIYKLDQILTQNRRINDVVLFKTQSEAHRRLHCRFPEQLMAGLFPDLTGESSPAGYHTYEYENTRDTRALVQAMRKAEFYGMMQKTLRKVDLGSMAVSLEVRVPFLKKSFIETALKIDPFLSYGPNMKKQILKNTLLDIYAEAPIDNVKRGFTVPLGDWFRTRPFEEYLKERLLQRSFLDRFGAKKRAVEDLISSHQVAQDKKWPLFTLLALEQSVA